MFGLSFDEIIYYIILGLSLSYLYKAVKQIATKDISFFKQELFTDESVEKWAVIDGLLKCSTALVCLVFGILSLLGIGGIWYVLVVFALNIILYLILYKKTLVRKQS